MASLAMPSSRGADISKGVVSLLGLVALVVVVPVLLVGFVGWPLPHAVPSVDAVTTALGDRYVPDRFLVGAIAIVCWIVWTELVASVVVEVIALARGRSADQVPFAAGAQKAAARLVAGVALLAALAASRGHEPAVRALTPASASPVVAGSFVQDAAVEAVGEAPNAAPTHTVVPRDTLWDISESCLSDPRRWTEIWELNKGRAMDDGRTFTDPDRIHPGWVLTLPADAAVGAVTIGPAPEGTLVGANVTPAAPAPAAAPAERVEVLQPTAASEEPGRVEVLRPIGGPELAEAADDSAAEGTTVDH